MALISCEECGAEISDKAQSCPKCGFPIKKESFSMELTRGQEIIALLVMAVIIFGFHISEEAAATKSREAADDWDDCARMYSDYACQDMKEDYEDSSDKWGNVTTLKVISIFLSIIIIVIYINYKETHEDDSK